MEWLHDALHDHTPCASWISDTEKWSEEARLCSNGLVFLLCVEALKLWRRQDCYHGVESGLLNRRIQHCCSQLWQLRSISYGFVCIVAGDLYSDYFEGRQTVENHLIHMGTYYYCTPTYAHNDIINLHLGYFFCGVCFDGSRFVCVNCENLYPAKIFSCIILVHSTIGHWIHVSMILYVHMEHVTSHEFLEPLWGVRVVKESLLVYQIPYS